MHMKTEAVLFNTRRSQRNVTERQKIVSGIWEWRMSGIVEGCQRTDVHCSSVHARIGPGLGAIEEKDYYIMMAAKKV